MNTQPQIRFRLNRLFWKVGVGFLILHLLSLPTSSQATVERPSQKFFHLGCLAGYPDGTFRGEQPMTRYEFIAALNACLEAIGNRSQTNLSSEELTSPAGRLEKYRQQLNQLRNQLDQLAPAPENPSS